MKVFQISICIAAILAMISLHAFADDAKSMDDQYLALAAQRTKAEVAFQKAEKLLDSRENGWDDINQSTSELHTKIVDVYSKTIRTESAKADRNQAMIDELNAQLKQVDQDWQTFNREQQKVNTAHNRLTQQYASQRSVYQGLVNQERSWKDGKMDLTVLGAAYDTVAKSIDDSSARMQKQLDAFKAKNKEWEDKLAAANKAVEGN